MVKNQNEFNEEFNDKEIKEVEIEYEDEDDFKGNLVIEDYSKLENLYLRDVKSVDKITLKNLTQLQECTIWNCGAKELVIEDCPKIKKLNVRKNLLTSLEFLANLENLEELEIDGNTKLTEILNSYESDWKTCQRDIQGLVKSVKENPRALSELKVKYADLKIFLREVWDSLSDETQKKLMNKLDDEIKNQEQINPIDRGGLNTAEIVLGVQKSLEGMKEIKKDLEMKVKELENNLHKVVTKKDELEKLKNEFVDKSVGHIDFDSKKKEKIRNNLEIYLASVGRQDNLAKLAGNQARDKLLKGKKEDSEIAKLLNKIVEKQKEISSLENQKKYIGKSLTESTQILIKEESSKSEKSLEYRNEKSEIQVGVQIPKFGVNIGITKKNETTTLDEYAQSHQETKLGQKLINKELQLQETEEQNQQAQIEHSPK